LQVSLVEKWSGCNVGTLNTPQYLFMGYILTSLEEHLTTLDQMYMSVATASLSLTTMATDVHII